MKVEASDPHTTNMGTCILYGKMKVGAAKIAPTFSNLIQLYLFILLPPRPELLEVGVLLY